MKQDISVFLIVVVSKWNKPNFKLQTQMKFVDFL